MNVMESMESAHSEHMGKREAPMDDDMSSTDTMTTTVKPMRHRKRSVSIQLEFWDNLK